MTATDTTFSFGRDGSGAFDNYGRVRDVTIVGTPAPLRAVSGFSPAVHRFPSAACDA